MLIAAPRPRPFFLVVATLSIGAVVSLALFGLSPLGSFLIREGMVSRWPHHLLFILDWTMMCIAMMLPTALPLFRALDRVVDRPEWQVRTALIVATGFVSVWLAFGFALRFGGLFLADVSGVRTLSAEARAQVGGAGLFLGGAYLLTPFAANCVAACQSPMSFIATRWRGQSNFISSSVRIGMAYGLSCFGCCWPLMFAMATFSITSPALMLFAAIFMAAQKYGEAGLLLTKFAGIALIGMGGSMAFRMMPFALNPMTWNDAARICGFT